MASPFFKNHGPINILEILNSLKIDSNNFNLKNSVNDIKDLFSANNTDITFFHSKKYKELVKHTKASFCITTKSLENDLPKTCMPISVENVLIAVSKTTEKFYPNASEDEFDMSVKNIEKTNFQQNVKYGKNVLLGENVKIGTDCMIGHNSIIEKNVHIGNNCKIGSNTIIRNTIINDNVSILDNCVIGKKGFGFFPNKDQNVRYPHIGIVIINDNSEIGCGSTIDRGSLSNTIIGKNTFLDNQIHVAHNNKIGNNCIIAGQVGFAGSSSLGDNVMIGGQAGISGHLKIGNNVHIGGGSGVIKDIEDNSKVMGYPARNLREFIKDNR